MIKAFQQVIDADRGDCLRACIASILELPIDQVPNWKIDNHQDMSRLINAWLAQHGLAFLSLSWLSPDNVIWHIAGYCILSMPSQLFPGRTHAVVGHLQLLDENNWRWDIVHDPNPQNKPYDRQTEPLRLYVLMHTGLKPG